MRTSLGILCPPCAKYEAQATSDAWPKPLTSPAPRRRLLGLESPSKAEDAQKPRRKRKRHQRRRRTAVSPSAKAEHLAIMERIQAKIRSCQKHILPVSAEGPIQALVHSGSAIRQKGQANQLASDDSSSAIHARNRKRRLNPRERKQRRKLIRYLDLPPLDKLPTLSRGQQATSSVVP